MTRSSKQKQIECRFGLERRCSVPKQASIICHRVLHRRYEWRSTLWQKSLETRFTETVYRFRCVTSITAGCSCSTWAVHHVICH